MQRILQAHFPWHKARLSFCASFLVAFYRRIQRFLADFALDFEQITCLVVALLPQKSDRVVTLDRINWRFGCCEINILMLAVAYRGLAFPLVWRLLGKAGNSNTAERIALVRRLLRALPASEIAVVVAERIEKLIALMAVAFAWAYLVGDWLAREARPIPVKSHGQPARSVFRYRLDHLREILFNIEVKWQVFCHSLHVLSCT